MCSFQTGVADYEWACTEPNDAGERYIPNITDREDQLASTGRDVIIIYSIEGLEGSCYGRVSRIKYCYSYNKSSSGSSVFNLTVLILDRRDNSSFTIVNKIILVSYPNSGTTKCTNTTCCDINKVSDLSLSYGSSFDFGVLQSSQQNTHTDLWGFQDSLEQYRVNVIQLNRNGDSRNLSVNSTLTFENTDMANRGLRMLWFILGKHQFIMQYIIILHVVGIISHTLEFKMDAHSGPFTESDKMTTKQLPPVHKDSNNIIVLAVVGALGCLFVLITATIISVVAIRFIVKKQQSRKSRGFANSDPHDGYHNAVYDCK